MSNSQAGRSRSSSANTSGISNSTERLTAHRLLPELPEQIHESNMPGCHVLHTRSSGSLHQILHSHFTARRSAIMTAEARTLRAPPEPGCSLSQCSGDGGGHSLAQSCITPTGMEVHVIIPIFFCTHDKLICALQQNPRLLQTARKCWFSESLT